MEWNDKVTLVQLSNSPDNKAEFQQFVLKHIDNLDQQAWDMLLNCSGFVLIEETITSEKKFYRKIYEGWKKLTFKETKDMSTRALLRAEVFILMFEELQQKQSA